MSGLDEAIRAAKQLEVDGEKYYLEAAANAKTDSLRQMFEALAADERKHIAWIEKLAPDGESAEVLNRELYAKLAPVFADTTPAVISEGKTDIEAVEFALSIEDKVIEIYTEWSANSDDERMKALGGELVAQERFHRQLLENVKQYFVDPGDWFMAEERWSFDGG